MLTNEYEAWKVLDADLDVVTENEHPLQVNLRVWAFDPGFGAAVSHKFSTPNLLSREIRGVFRIKCSGSLRLRAGCRV